MPMMLGMPKHPKHSQVQFSFWPVTLLLVGAASHPLSLVTACLSNHLSRISSSRLPCEVQCRPSRYTPVYGYTDIHGHTVIASANEANLDQFLQLILEPCPSHCVLCVISWYMLMTSIIVFHSSNPSMRSPAVDHQLQLVQAPGVQWHYAALEPGVFNPGTNNP